MGKLAEAFVEIRPEDDHFRAEARRLIEAALVGLEGLVDLGVDGDAFRSEARQVVSAATAALHGEIGLEADGSGLRGDIARTAKLAAEGVAAEVDVDADATGLRGEVSRAASAAAAGQSIDIPVRTRRASVLAGGGLGGGGRVPPGAGAGGDGLERLGRQALGGAAGLKALSLSLKGVKFGTLISGATAALSAITALTAGAGALIGALGPATGILGALPQLATVASQGLGTVLLASSGIGGAVKAMGKAQLEAGKEGKAGAEAARVGLLAQEAAAERVRDATISLGNAQESAADRGRAAVDRVSNAERGLEQAQRGARNAQVDLNDARRSAEDRLRSLEELVSDYALSEEDAVLRVEEARERLRDVSGRGPTLDFRRANLGVRQAEEALDDLRRARREDTSELEDATAKGVNGADEVVAAHERVHGAQQDVVDSAREVAEAQAAAQRSAVDSARDVAEAQRDLSLALRDQARASEEVLTKSSASADALAVALAELSPEAQSLAEALFSLRPELDALQDAAGEKLLPGIEASLVNLSTLLPIFRTGAREAGGAIGDFAVNLSALLAASDGDISIISGRNVELLDAFGDATVDVVAGLRDVIIAAEPLSDFLGDSARAFGTWTREASAAGRESGNLAEFFERSSSTLSQLGRITENTGRLLGNVFGAGAEHLGRDLLDSFERLTANAERFTESVEGQARLKEIYEEARPVLTEIGDLLGDIGTGLLDLGADSNTAALLAQIRTELLPVLLDLAGSVSAAFGPAVISAITEFAELLGVLFAQSGTLTILVETFASFAEVLNYLIEELPGFAEFVGLIITISTIRGLGSIATKLGGIASAAFGFSKEAGAATGAAGRLSGALAKVGPSLVIGAALYGISKYSESMEKARLAAVELREELTGEGLSTNNLDVLTQSSSDVGFAMQGARQDLRELYEASGADRGGVRGFLGGLDIGARRLVENLSPLPDTLANTEAQVDELEGAFADLDPRLAAGKRNFKEIADATGLTKFEVAALADQLGLDIAGPFGETTVAIVGHYNQLALQAGYAGSAAADAAGVTLEALAEQAQSVQEFRDTVTGAYGSATDVVGNFASATTVSKEEILAFFDDQVEAARNWSTNLAELAASGIDEGLLKEVAEAGPAAAPLLQGLLDAVADGGVEAINQARADLAIILANTLDDITEKEVPARAAGFGVGDNVRGGLGEGFNGPAIVIDNDAVVRSIFEGIVGHEREAGEVGFGLGDSIATGMAAGLNPDSLGGQLVGDAAELLISRALERGQAKAETGSPSRLFAREVGLPIAQGLALGLRQGLPGVLAAGESMVTDLAGLDFSIPALPGPGVGLGAQGQAVRAGLAVADVPGDVPQPPSDSLGPLLDELRRLRAIVAGLQSNVSFGDIKVEPKDQDLASAIPRAIRRERSLGRF